MKHLLWRSLLASVLGWLVLAATSALAHDDGVSYIEGARAPKGFARPPFHTKPHASIAATAVLTPALTRHAYGFDTVANQGSGMVVAIVDAFDDPNIESDLNAFSQTFALPRCTSLNGCFSKVYAAGYRPRVDAGWSLEMALDVEWAHAIAPLARIILVEAASNSFGDLMVAVDVAVKRGASVVSMSFGGSEFSGETLYDIHFSVPGVTFVASSGDGGDGTEYPAASPHIVSVGGTTLSADRYGSYLGETAWSGSGGGVSSYEPEPAGQATWPIPVAGKRGVPDVSYDADPSTGFAVYDSVSYQRQSGWFVVGGTSAGAPQWSALIAIANSLRVAAGKSRLSATYNALYAVGKSAYGSDYHDVTIGSNGTCGLRCTATGGYDYVTGLGTPQVGALVPALVNQP
jgi:subtilase family serine protease